MNFEENDQEEEDLDLSCGFDHGYGQVSEYSGIKEQSATNDKPHAIKPIKKHESTKQPEFDFNFGATTSQPAPT